MNIPAVSSIHLPEPVQEAQKPDEFGFVFLQDGSAGAFYTSLGDNLADLWRLFPSAQPGNIDTLQWIEYLLSPSQATRAVGLGAFNALSQHVMRRAGYSAADVTQPGKLPRAGQRVALVGFIRPMAEQLLQNGMQVLVLEKNPARVERLPGLIVSTQPGDLRQADFIICTASTLINDSLDEILQNRNPNAYFSLVGPSGSGLPDILFEHGVDEVGGILFDDVDMLQSALQQQQAWGRAGRKYRISMTDYPGVENLLESIDHHRSN